MKRLTNFNARSLQRGISLIEIMVAMVISLLLIAGTIQIFANSKQAYRMQEALSRVQENGRFAIKLLARDVRMGDFWGCAKASKISNRLNPGGAVNYGGDGIIGVDGDPNPDSITLRGAYDTGLIVQLPYMPTPSSALQVPVNSGLQVSEIVLVSDCIAGDLFQITGPTDPNNTGTANHNPGGSYMPGNATGSLSKTYRGDASLFRVQELQYFIAPGASGEPALFRVKNGGAPQELVEGIEDMQISYGVDTTAPGNPGEHSANYYVSAGSIAAADWPKVVSVRISLLARSAADNITPQAQAIAYNGGVVNPGDRRLRHVFTTTVSVRNRLK